MKSDGGNRAEIDELKKHIISLTTSMSTYIKSQKPKPTVKFQASDTKIEMKIEPKPEPVVEPVVEPVKKSYVSRSSRMAGFL